MLAIPLSDRASQSLDIQLGGKECTIALYKKSTGLFCDVRVAGVLVIGGVLCQDANRIVRDPYLGFPGDLVFSDTLGKADPTSPGLGTRFLLQYMSAAEVAALTP